MYFLLVYSRAQGRVLSLREYPETERGAALTERFRLEKEEKSNPDLEIIVLGSESRANLEATHSRYFKKLSELGIPVSNPPSGQH